MQCYTELTPPTAVTHSIALPFTSAQRQNLVVARGSLLQIFITKAVSAELDKAQNTQLASSATASGRYDSGVHDDEGLEASFLGGDSVLLRADRSSFTKLILVAEYCLAGTVTGLARVKVQASKSGGEALLLSFKDAKLGMVEWDAEKHVVHNTSLHYYEQDELQRLPWAAPLGDYVNYMAVDPGSRCAALKFGARNLAILQFSHADEDIEMDDWDEQLDGPRPVRQLSRTVVNGTSSNEEDAANSLSFVLRLSNLDPSLIHPVHLAFLHEYREPTFGILSSTMEPSTVLPRKDHVSYMVFTLDLKQKASTTILSVNGLPQDLFRVVALPAPIGGALLVGTNELIHIEQSGKSHGVGVNPFTKQTTSFGLVDQSDLDLRLEGCVTEMISAEAGELLLVLADGRLGLIKFRIDGRTVSGLGVEMVSPEAGGSLIPAAVSTLTKLGKNCAFAGSEDGDSLVIGWVRKHNKVTRKRARLVDDAGDMDMDYDEMDETDEDDLYAPAQPVQQGSTAALGSAVKQGELVFRVHDRLVSIAPIRDFTIGQGVREVWANEDDKTAGPDEVSSELSLVCAVGRGRAGGLAIINREIQPRVIGRFEFPEAKGFWTMAAQKPMPKSLDKTLSADFDPSAQYDEFMMVAKVDVDGYETSDVYALTGAGFEALTGTEFDPAAGFTVDAGSMGRCKRVIQVLKAEVRCYDGDFGLTQILPMLDEDTGSEPRVISASIVDPFLLLVRDDWSVCIFKMDSHLELEELDRQHAGLVRTKWLTGCLYQDISGIFSRVRTDEDKDKDKVFIFLLSGTGALHVYELPDLSRPVYVAEGLPFVPPDLSAAYAARRGSAKETVAELLVADLGDATCTSPYLIVRHANDDLTIYQPLRAASAPDAELPQSLHFQKVSNRGIAKSPVEADVETGQDEAGPEQPTRRVPLRRCADVGGYSTVFLPGASPSFVIKSSKTLPRVMGVQGNGVQNMSPFHTQGCPRGFIYADSRGITRVAQIPTADTSYADLGMSCRKVSLGLDVNSVSHHPPSNTYVVGCGLPEPFELPKEDDYHKEWQKEKDLDFKPVGERGLINLLNPSNWTVVDRVEMEEREMVMCVETLDLEMSETTHERRQVVVVGTAIDKGEDVPIKGRILVYDVVTVIPQPDRPETDRRLKLVAKEDIPRGAVTALSEIGSQGLLLVAQGQKCMVRGLKEDGTLLPVAFMDMNCYVTAARELRGTRLCVMSDAVKGVWFVGYTEDPYKMVLLGKSASLLEVLAVDFLPDGNDLSIVAFDSDGGIHVLQYDPDHPKSLGGHLLLHRTTFSVGANLPTRSLLLPRTLPPGAEAIPHQPTTNGNSHQGGAEPESEPEPQPQTLLLTSPTGLIATLTPLAEQEYRQLSSLASQLSTSLPHFGGLNPKAHRAPTSSGVVGRHPPAVDAGVGRTVVDGALLARWNELGAARRADIAGRVGFGDVVDVRAALRSVLGPAGLAYF